MVNIADIAVAVIILLSAFIGYKRGLIKTAFGFLSFFLAIALTFMFYQPVMGIIKEKTEFVPWLSSYLYHLDTNQAVSDAPSQQVETEESYIEKLPDTVVELIGLNEIKENAKTTIVEKIVEFAVKLLAIVIVYIVARVLLFIAVLILDSIAKLPVLKQFNEISGLAVGVILGFIRVYGVFLVITLLGSLSVTNQVVSVINQSLFASVLYNNNLILKILF